MISLDWGLITPVHKWLTAVYNLENSDNRRLMRVILAAALLHFLFLAGVDFFPHAQDRPSFKKTMTSTFSALDNAKAKGETTRIAVNLERAQPLGQENVAALAPLSAQKTQAHKRKTISAAAHGSQDAAYLGHWQQYVEKYGNAHYPAEALKHNWRGELRLLVAINRDGSLREVSLRQSSGNPVLDEAAINIVKAAAPFEPLPAQIAQEVEVLEIIRTWQFRGKLSTS